MKSSYPMKYAAILILSAMLATGCTTNAATTNSEDTAATAAKTDDVAAVDGSEANTKLAGLKIKDVVEYDTDDTNADWKADDTTTITLSSTSATVNGEGAKASGGDVTISSAGTYVVSGKLTDGSIVVDAGENDLVHLVLNGAHIISSDGPAIQINKAGKTVLTLNEETNNTLSDGTTYADTSEDAPTAALYSQEDLSINGTGKLTVQGNYKDGITSKDDLKIVSGTLNVNAADDGIIGRDLAAVKSGTIHVNAGGDGFKTTYDGDEDKGYLVIEDGTFQIETGSDGFQAAATLLIDGGTYKMVNGGGSENSEPHQEEKPMGRPDSSGQERTGAQSVEKEAQSTGSDADNVQAGDEESESTSMKGLKAEGGIAVIGGTFSIDSADDSVHSNGSILISGGQLALSTGDDGIHADVSIVISGGVVNIKKSYEGIEAADINISGGEVHIVASDDGLNASDGSVSTEGPGGMFGGEPPAGMQGQDPVGDQAKTEVPPQEGDNKGTSNETGTEQPAAGQEPPAIPSGGPGGSGGTAKLTISGGFLTVNAQGDGLDSNGSITMTGGTALVNGPTSNGNGALDYDGTFLQSGGVLIAAGSAGMAQAPSESSSQRSVQMTFPSTVTAGTLVTLSDNKGTPVLSFAPAKDIQTIVISSPDLKASETYTFYTGGKSTGTSTGGLTEKGQLTGGTMVVSFKLSDTVTYVNESGVTTGGGGFGGGRGQGGPGGGRGGAAGQRGTTNQNGTNNQDGAASNSDSTTSETDQSSN